MTAPTVLLGLTICRAYVAITTQCSSQPPGGGGVPTSNPMVGTFRQLELVERALGGTEGGVTDLTDAVHAQLDTIMR
jgi:hypothetical protein